MVDAPRHLDPLAQNSALSADSVFDQFLPVQGISTDAFKPRAAVYMLWAADRPILLSTTANLKHAINLRLGPDRAAHKTNYQAITTHISWRYVNSAFAANWWYLHACQTYYPDQYRTLLGWRPAWFVRIDTGTPTEPPSVDVRNTVGTMDGCTFGPFSSRRDARGLADWLLEQFELCRYEDILRKSPHGRPCAYKEMGKCPAPCDGSVSMDSYRQTVRDAITLMTQMAPMTRTVTIAADMPWYRLAVDRMKQAAVKMDFRLAGKIKNQIQALSDQFQSVPAGWGPVDQWKYIALQRGSTARWIEPWLVTPGICRSLPSVEVKAALADGSAFIRGLKAQCDDGSSPSAPVPIAADRLDDVFALLTWHLNRSRDPGLYLSPADLRREWDVAQHLADWTGQPATSAVMEMATDAADRPVLPEPDEAAGNNMM